MEPEANLTAPSPSVSLQLVTLDGEAPGTERRAEPLTIGLPIARGVCRSVETITVRSPHGSPLPTQARVTDRWPDGSVRWVVIDTLVNVPAAPSHIVVEFAPAASTAGRTGLTVTETRDGIEVDTRAGQFTVAKSGVDLFARVRIDDGEPVNCELTGFRVEDANGAGTPILIGGAAIEERGPIRTVVRVDATAQLGEPALAPIRLTCRLHFFDGSSAVRLAVTLHNPRRAVHAGGFWDLGDPASVQLRDFCFTTTLRASGEVSGSYSSEPGHPVRRFSSGLEVYQDSSGGSNFRSSNHVDAGGNIPIAFQGYRERVDGEERAGLRANPVVTLTHGRTSVSCGMQHFWENFPKSLEATEDTITLRLFPRHSAGLHELQGGEQKTHVFVVAFGRDAVSDEALEWVRRPVCAVASPAYYCGTGAVRYLGPRSDDQNHAYLDLVDAAIQGPDTFAHKREVVDEYGWRHFGEIYGDHEGVRQEGGSPLVSHYNNQYDPIAGFTYQFLRSGNPRWMTQAQELAAHVLDIDIYHTDLDKPGYNHGLFWHTVHYVDAGTATHRSYPRAAAAHANGGGPSCEHLYTTGLMLHHFLTGDPQSREAVVNMARLVLDVDDGTKSAMRWLSRENTGWASASGSFSYHGPGRGPGNAVNALLDAHRLTQSREFLDKAEQLIRRCVHPHQDLDALGLLDAERRWYYTVFLQGLGKYLDYKAERQELDDAYAYARASLLHYARWMARHEYPILDKPEILEYPTETWAAQDMRKSEVFKYAAIHAADGDREQFLERADYFFGESTQRLMQMPTRSLARPVVLLLSYGFMHAWMQHHSSFAAPAPQAAATTHGLPTAFVPQRIVAKKRAVALMAAVAASVLGGLSFLLLR